METVIATMKPEDIHCARCWPTTKYRLMSGMATLMIVDDMMAATEPAITENSSSQH